MHEMQITVTDVHGVCPSFCPSVSLSVTIALNDPHDLRLLHYVGSFGALLPNHFGLLLSLLCQFDNTERNKR